MVICLLISLGESMVVSLTSPVISIPTKVWFHFVSLCHFNIYSFNLIILHSDFYFKFIWHYKFVSFDGVKIMLLLVFITNLLNILLLLHIHLLLHLHLLVWVNLSHHLLLLLHLHHLLIIDHLLSTIHILLLTHHILTSHILCLSFGNWLR